MKKNRDIEYLVCSAIHFDNGIEANNPHRPRNIKTGIVFMGLRHCNCYDLMYSWSRLLLNDGLYIDSNFTLIETMDKVKEIFGKYHKIEGFLSNHNNFYNREEALKIAKKVGQVETTISRELTSEDLW